MLNNMVGTLSKLRRIDRKPVPSNPSADDSPGRIIGYALATDSLRLQTTGRYTVELEIFIKPDHKRRGIGKCLLDKLIGMRDATYVPKRGFFYVAGCDDKSFAKRGANTPYLTHEQVDAAKGLVLEGVTLKHDR
ncbi:hypothetical protein IFM58399_06265 [Aspergillus lentulus]|uniref:N-acetyltransferase domain-containing protein n=1 Tax=Aspergillus lentulus TaxID=293939 RepID=A0ABQ1A4V0_ASPLE|nr:uncharacterized protein IFM58399_06265 [Aspergillus lentulus]GFF41435.1 hypothetical protein IFM58399_06265 [Aspergillus lentulus]GFF57057.1 hypothetical protein IFM62136_03296 [Aspergillus lentulus]GFF73565.1 hypothetical protein IFM60648_03968 [Aspergillus lentulus]GFF88040.1 hypothetical protein IFM47457_07677 [Aspergillus lentulus]GFG11819.1 hypothetical protein IFM61392_07094 [Aspergillus lentulus]